MKYFPSLFFGSFVFLLFIFSTGSAYALTCNSGPQTYCPTNTGECPINQPKTCSCPGSQIASCTSACTHTNGCANTTDLLEQCPGVTSFESVFTKTSDASAICKRTIGETCTCNTPLDDATEYATPAASACDSSCKNSCTGVISGGGCFAPTGYPLVSSDSSCVQNNAFSVCKNERCAFYSSYTCGSDEDEMCCGTTNDSYHYFEYTRNFTCGGVNTSYTDNSGSRPSIFTCFSLNACTPTPCSYPATSVCGENEAPGPCGGAPSPLNPTPPVTPPGNSCPTGTHYECLGTSCANTSNSATSCTDSCDPVNPVCGGSSTGGSSGCSSNADCPQPPNTPCATSCQPFGAVKACQQVDPLCGAPTCNYDGICDPGETPGSCPSDCSIGTPFNIVILPSFRTVYPGDTTSYTVNINTRRTGDLTLSVSGCPTNATCSFDQNMFTISSGSVTSYRTATLFVVAGAIPANTYTLTVNGSIYNSVLNQTYTQSADTQLVVNSGANNATCVSVNAPTSVAPGSSFIGTIQMKNSGSKTWTNISRSVSDGAHALSFSPLNTSVWGSGTNQISLANTYSPTAPGQSALFTTTFTAPSAPGTYPFSFQMIQNGVQVFGQVCRQPGGITVTNVPPSRAPIVTIFADPLTGPTPLDTRLTWVTGNNPDLCIASGGWRGRKSENGGSEPVLGLTNPTVFTLRCSNSNGSNSFSKTVIPAPPLPTFSVSVNKTVGGTVTSIDNGISCGRVCSKTYPKGSTVILQAIPDTVQWKFIGWTTSPAGSCSGTGDCVLNITGPVSITAHFEPRSLIYQEF